MKLNDTIEMMNSEDYKERFKAEYWQLCIRAEGLRVMLEKYKDGKLNFKPKCSYELLNDQLISMYKYREMLELRAIIEDVKL